MRICIVCSLDHRPRTAHRAPRTAHRAPPTAHRLPPTAHHAPPTAHRGSCRCGGPRCEALPSIKIRLQTVYKVRHDALPHGTLVRAPSDESVGAARPESRCTRLTGRAREHTGGAVGGEEGGRNAKGHESTLGCRRSQLVNHEVVPPVRAEVGSGRPRESTGCGARLGCGPAPLQVAFAKDVRYPRADRNLPY